MIDLEDFVDNVMLTIPTALENTVEAAVRESAIRFCRETGIYKITVKLVSDGSTAELDIITPDDVRIRKLKNVWFTPNGGTRQRLSSATPMNGEDFGDARGTPTQWFRDGVILHVNGNLAGVYTLDMRVNPSRTFMELPDTVGEDYFDAICAGALGIMFETPDKPWTNTNAADTYKRTFALGMMDAKNDASRSPERPVRKVKYRGI